MINGFEIGFAMLEAGILSLGSLLLDSVVLLVRMLFSDVFGGMSSQAVVFDDQQIGSVGTLVGASLETAGHYIQSDFLDIINDQLGHSLGALLFILGAFVALFTIAVGGNYKFGMWFLVGPALFWWMVSARVDSVGANWKFGSNPYDQERVWKVSEAHTESPETAPNDPAQRPDPAQVSWFFKWYASLSSDIVNGLIAALQLTNNDMQDRFIHKAERYQMLFDLESTDPKIKLFTGILAQSKCARYYLLTREANNPHRDNQYKNAIQAQLDEMGNDPVLSEDEALDVKKFIEDFDLDPDDMKLSEDPFADDVLTCNEIWAISVGALSREIELQLAAINNASPPDGMTSEQEIRDWRRRQIDTTLVKFAMRVDKDSGEVTSIFDLGDPGERQQATIQMINELAARAFMNELGTQRPALAQLGRDRHDPDTTKVGDDGKITEEIRWDNQEMSREIRAMSATEEYKGKGDFLAAMLSMPYIQGLLLYFLSLTFPFFAFLLIVPGRHGGFFLWMGMWFWAKSWDFGFALVMVVDEILYVMLPHGPPISDTSAVDTNYIAEVTKTVLEMDPTYSIHTYYNLIAACLAAVPVLTGVMIKKGGNEVMHAVNQGFTNFTGRIGNAMASQSRSLKAQSNAAQVNKNVQKAVEQASLSAIGDSKVLSNALGGAGMQAFNKLSAMRAKGVTSGAEWKKNYNQVMQAMSGQFQKQRFAIASAQYKLNLTEAAYKESWSAENRILAADTMLQKYYFHDFQMRADKLLNAQWDVQQAERMLQSSKAIQKFWQNEYKSLGRALMTGDVGGLAKSGASMVGLSLGDAATRLAVPTREEQRKKEKPVWET